MENINKALYHANVNVNLIVEYVIQTKSRITINVDASASKIIIYEKYYIIFSKNILE